MEQEDNTTQEPQNQYIPEERSDQTSYRDEQILIDGKPYYYVDYGKEFGQKTNAQPEALHKAYDKIYRHLLEFGGLDNTTIAKRISRLESELKEKEAELEERSNAINKLNNEIEAHKKQIREIETDITEIKDGRGYTSKFISWVTGIGLILLTIVLIGIYYHYSYFIFGGKGVNSSRISALGDLFQTPIFTILTSKGAYLSLLINICFSGGFFVLGILLHNYYSRKDWIKFGAITLFTFLADMGISYRLAKMIHDDELSALMASGGINGVYTPEQQAKITELNNWSFISDSNFWILIALGFCFFVVWGIALAEFRQLIDPNSKIQDLKERIQEIQKKIDELQTEISKIESIKILIQKDIQKIKGDIAALKSGVVPIDYPKLKALLGLFMQGWFSFVVFLWDKDHEKQEEKINAGNEQQLNWLQEKQGQIKSTR